MKVCELLSYLAGLVKSNPLIILAVVALARWLWVEWNYWLTWHALERLVQNGVDQLFQRVKPEKEVMDPGDCVVLNTYREGHGMSPGSDAQN